jgi:hypothetical protein
MKKIFIVVSSLILFIGCGENGSEETKNDFDRVAMLVNWADNIIIPSYENYQSKVGALNNAILEFNANPTEAGLVTVRNNWKEAYIAFQYVAIYSVGKAEEISFKESSNTYPTDVAGINSNIQTNTYDLGLLSQFSKQGFPALDYLINGLASSDASIVDFYLTNANAENYKKYIAAVSLRLKTQSDVIVTDWKGFYRIAFINNNRNGVSGSINKVANNFVKNFEKDIRTGKIGIPAGLFSSGKLFPEKTEANYAGSLSKDLLNASIQASLDFFNGKKFGAPSTGLSLKQYLDFVKAVRDNQSLSDIINKQYTNIFNANNGLNNSLSQQVTTDNSKMISSYDTIQQNVVYLKLDMLQALSIAISYVDSDND